MNAAQTSQFVPSLKSDDQTSPHAEVPEAMQLVCTLALLSFSPALAQFATSSSTPAVLVERVMSNDVLHHRLFALCGSRTWWAENDFEDACLTAGIPQNEEPDAVVQDKGVLDDDDVADCHHVLGDGSGVVVEEGSWKGSGDWLGTIAARTARQPSGTVLDTHSLHRTSRWTHSPYLSLQRSTDEG